MRVSSGRGIVSAMQSSWYQLWRLIVEFYGDGEKTLGPILTEFFDTVPIAGPRTTLCELMTRYGSDKGSSWHNYTLLYHFLFRHHRHRVRSVFELGIGTNFLDTPSNMGPNGSPGASLRAWRDYFPNARIVGADIDRRVLFSEDRITTRQVDQRSKESIDGLWRHFDDVSFDIMIDDGLHEVDANAIFMQNSVWKLRPHGFYVIEDIVANDENLQRFGEFARSSNATGALIKVPSPTNNHDNCLAIFEAAAD
jgi:hypothetical protein